MRRETLLLAVVGTTLGLLTATSSQAELGTEDPAGSSAEATDSSAPVPEPNPFADLAPPEPTLEAEPAHTEPTAKEEPLPASSLPTPAPSPSPLFAASPPASMADSSRSSRMVLGPVGIDSQGRRGRIHTVAKGHTLWDISEAYLGTPWVWPSIWDENARISNPHLIFPSDRIWITSTEMRLISEEEADALIASAEAPLPVEEPTPVPSEEMLVEEPIAEVPAAMEQLPVRLRGGDRARVGDTGQKVRVNWRHLMSFMSTHALEGASSIVESPEARVWLAESDSVYLGIGEGDVAVGDHFMIFADPAPVRDPVDGTLLGYHVDVLGRLEVVALSGETSIGRIVESISEIQRGAFVTAYEPAPPVISVKHAPAELEGRIVFMPANRTAAGDTDYVYLNRGEIHGLEIGSGLQVVDHGGVETDRARRAEVLTPDNTVADLVVVSVEPDSSVALVTHATRELSAGDTIRGAGTRSVR